MTPDVVVVMATVVPFAPCIGKSKCNKKSTHMLQQVDTNGKQNTINYRTKAEAMRWNTAVHKTEGRKSAVLAVLPG